MRFGLLAEPRFSLEGLSVGFLDTVPGFPLDLLG